jgi:hypothetical protein
LYKPASVRSDSHNNIYVADSQNCRVLEYNTPLASNNHTANHVWGQAGSLTSQSCNLGGVTASSLNTPNDLALDVNNNLYIADYRNNRVLEFNETANPPTNTTANPCLRASERPYYRFMQLRWDCTERGVGM